MQTFLFKTQQIFEKQTLAEVFAFFSDVHNLAVITPLWLHFEVLTPAPIEMKVGTQIDYQMKYRGIRIRWQSEITAWHPPYAFTDEQRRGPYRRWHHRHIFAATAGGIVVGDIVEYAVWGNWFVNRWLVRPDIEKLFAYRSQKLKELFHRSSSA